MANVFMSYRRDDSQSTTGRLHDWLERKYGKRHVFQDVYSLTLGGADFRTHIAAALQKSNVVLVIIGPHWLNMSNPKGQRRLDNPDDFVRIEIEVAFTNEIPVIPVLVEGAAPLQEDQLPTSLKRLAHLQAVSVRNGKDFPDDTNKLIGSIDTWLRHPRLVEETVKGAPNINKTAALQQARVRRYTLASAALAVVVLITVVLLIVTKLGPSIPPQPQVNFPATISVIRGTATAFAGSEATAVASFRAPTPSSPQTPATSQLGLDTVPVVVTLTVDWNGLLADDSSASASVIQAVSHVKSLQGRRAGLVFTYDGSPDQSGTATAEQVGSRVNTVLQTLGGQGQIFEGTVYDSPLFILGQSHTYVKLDIYLYTVST